MHHIISLTPVYDADGNLVEEPEPAAVTFKTTLRIVHKDADGYRASSDEPECSDDEPRDWQMWAEMPY